MKRIYLFILIPIICGCATYHQKIDRYINNLEQSDRFEEIVIEGSYQEVFQAVLTVFHDLSLVIPKKDFEGKKIYGVIYGEGQRLALFKEENGKIKVVLKSSGFYYDDRIILEKIQEEIELQKRLGNNVHPGFL